MSKESEHQVAFEWGSRGLIHLLPQSDVIIIVDVLSFSTCVDIAVSQGASVYPYRWKDDSANTYAQKIEGYLAVVRNPLAQFSLSPQSMFKLKASERIVLASPNGAELSLLQSSIPVYTACLRNAASVAQGVREMYGRIGIVAAGERWEDNSLRPAIEDFLGAGAVIHSLSGFLSPEAEMAKNAFTSSRENLFEILFNSISGRELIERGYEEDVRIASELNISNSVPQLTEKNCFKNKALIFPQ
ncbi:MAG TPA: 2-phosphosulfolactate phosphatase [Candidatus Kapabacteria bacterium]|nr:2-phosphosulfolactate phosphatase [Candidatus Kapabacteria bacterium]